MKALVLLVQFAVVFLTACGGSSGGSETQVLRQQVADAQSTTGTWKMFTVIALVIGVTVGLVLGGRDDH